MAASAGRVAPSPYQFKPSPYSSHSLLLAALPASGAHRRVLDLGCAGGYLASLLAARGFRVTGVERAEALPADSPEGVDLVPADLDQGLPKLAGRFDYILCADILEHLRDPARLLGEVHRVLAPGGRLVASLPNSGNLYFRLNVLAGRFPRHERGLFDRTHLHFYTWDGWIDLFRSAGWRIDTVHPSGIPVGLGLPRLDGTALVRALERLCYDFGRVWKRLFAYQFIVVARPEK
jgi:SAM-dependent methyltransferase